MNRLLDQLILAAGVWRDTEDPIVEQQFSALFEQLKELAGLDRAAAEDLLLEHIAKGVAA